MVASILMPGYLREVWPVFLWGGGLFLFTGISPVLCDFQTFVEIWNQSKVDGGKVQLGLLEKMN